jgi:serine/threonine-protein kinase HipA
MARAKHLGVWLDGVHVADLEQRRWPEIRCHYRDEALERWPLNSPVLSCSLPLESRPADALAFCAGLLPEGQALATLAANANLAANDTFELLRRYGRDVAGALVIADSEPQSREFGVEPYSEQTLTAAVEELDEFPLGAHEDSELSLAGLQDKLLLVRLPDGSWGRPLSGRPSTHILKRDDSRYPGLVDAEAECLALARAASLTSVATELLTLGTQRCLIVSRFDRYEEDGGVGRVHQEDLCQALAIDPSQARGRIKYERAGGSSLRSLAELLENHAADPQAELDRLLAATTYTVLIGNADAHGKNLALLHPSAEEVELAPLYDTVPTVLWPNLRREAAMAIGGQPMLADVTVGDLVREAGIWRHPAERAHRVVGETVETILTAVEDGVVDEEGSLGKSVRSRGAELLAEMEA